MPNIPPTYADADRIIGEGVTEKWLDDTHVLARATTSRIGLYRIVHNERQLVPCGGGYVKVKGDVRFRIAMYVRLSDASPVIILEQ